MVNFIIIKSRFTSFKKTPKEIVQEVKKFVDKLKIKT